MTGSRDVTVGSRRRSRGRDSQLSRVLRRAPRRGPSQLPPPVRPGDRVGVAALSGPVDPMALEAGLACLRDLGFEPVPAANLGRSRGMFAGSDSERLDAFHCLAADPSLTAILFARGGYGVLRLLPEIDWKLLREHPRAYVAYSDVTPLLLEIERRLGWVTFHGPMVAVDLARGLFDVEVESFRTALAGKFPRYRVASLEGAVPAAPVEGVLRGGCLSMIAASVGTAFAADFRDSIVFLEDIEEPAYRLDRMLTQLRLAGGLNGARGLVLGRFGHGAAAGSEIEHARWIETLNDFGRQTGLPVGTGLAFGHGQPNLTLPIGLSACLDLERGFLEVAGPG